MRWAQSNASLLTKLRRLRKKVRQASLQELQRPTINLASLLVPMSRAEDMGIKTTATEDEIAALKETMAEVRQAVAKEDEGFEQMIAERLSRIKPRNGLRFLSPEDEEGGATADELRARIAQLQAKLQEKG